MRLTRQDKAVKLALEAQGNIISPGMYLDLSPFLQPSPKRRKGKFSHIHNGKHRTYQQLYNEKNRAGFKSLSVAEYCNFLALQETEDK